MGIAAGTGLALVINEDRALAALWRNHARMPNASHRLALFDYYRSFARRVALNQARRMPELGLDREDYVQLANEALLQSIDRFDPTIGSPFEAFARTRIVGHVRNGALKASESSAQYGYRRRIERERLASLRTVEAKDDLSVVDQLAGIAAKIALGFILEDQQTPDPDTLPTADPSAYDALAWRELCAELDRRLKQLPEREAFVLDRHYRHADQFQHIAALLGVSKGRISQLHGQGLERLRKSMRRLD
jgi:RNA polymerase sigma factor FliA